MSPIRRDAHVTKTSTFNNAEQEEAAETLAATDAMVEQLSETGSGGGGSATCRNGGRERGGGGDRSRGHGGVQGSTCHRGGHGGGEVSGARDDSLKEPAALQQEVKGAEAALLECERCNTNDASTAHCTQARAGMQRGVHLLGNG